MRQKWTPWTLSVVSMLLAATAMTQAAERTHQIEPEDYFDIGVVAEVALAPNGQYVAYTEVRWGGPDERRTSDLWVVTTADPQRTRLTFERLGARSPAWSPDSEYIYFLARRSRAGEDHPPYDGSSQVWRVSPHGGEPLAVTRVDDGVDAFVLSRDGRQLLYTRSTEQQDDDDFKALRETYSYLEYGHGVVDYSQVWSLDLVGWTERKLVDDHRVVQDLALSPDGKHLAMITTPDDQLISHEGWSRVDVLDLDADDAEVQHLTSPQWRKSHPSPYGWLENLAWSDDSKALAFMISFDGYPSELYVAEWLGGSPSVRKLDRPAEVTVSDFGAPTWRADSRDLCYMGEDRARLRLYEIANVRGGRQGDTRTLTPDDVVIHAYSVPRSGKGPIAVVKSTTTDTRNVFLLDGPGEYTRLTQVNPQVDTWKLPQISIVKWSGARGDTVEGILELPPDYQPGDGPLPLVVELHGGPTAATLYRMRFWIYGRTLLAAKGYALLSPNYRGSTGYGDDFMTDLVGHENNIEIEDILKGVDAMIERGIADPEHLAVMGWSNGGLLTNCIITHTDRFKAASTGAGIVDMVLQWGTEDTPGHVINYMEGFPWEKPDAYRHASAVYALDKITTPTLIHVGGSDHRCPPAHSQALHRALHRYLDVPTQLVVYPGEGHSPLIRKHRLAKMKWDLAWFDKYLLGKDTANEESEE